MTESETNAIRAMLREVLEESYYFRVTPYSSSAGSLYTLLLSTADSC